MIPYRNDPSSSWLKWAIDSSRKRTRISKNIEESLSIAGFPSQAIRCKFCGYYFAEYQGEEGKILRQIKCNSRYCPSCSRERASRILSKVTLQERKLDPAVNALVTFTAGRTVAEDQVEDRVLDLKTIFRRWRRVESDKHGLMGGWYGFEVTYTKDHLYNVHMHIYARYSRNSVWLLRDRAYIRCYHPSNFAWTPAYMHIYLTWLDAMKREKPSLYDDLDDRTPEEWQEIEQRGICEFMSIDLNHLKFVSVDINGRYPGYDHKALQIGSEDLEEDQEVILKYVSKNLRNSEDHGNSMYMVPIIRAFHRKRRCQGFGDLYNVPVSLDEILEHIERETGEEIREKLTAAEYAGRILSVDQDDPQVGIGKYLYAYSDNDILHIEGRVDYFGSYVDGVEGLRYIHTNKVPQSMRE